MEVEALAGDAELTKVAAGGEVQTKEEEVTVTVVRLEVCASTLAESCKAASNPKTTLLKLAMMLASFKRKQDND